MEPDVQSASRRTGDSGRPRESLEQRVRELPASKIQQMMANAVFLGLLDPPSPSPCPIFLNALPSSAFPLP